LVVVTYHGGDGWGWFSYSTLIHLSIFTVVRGSKVTTNPFISQLKRGDLFIRSLIT
jgi:hypothetical protein